MELTYFAVIVLLFGLWASGTRMIMVFVVACLFGGSAAVSVTALGGAPINPAAFALPFLLFWALRSSGTAGFSHHLVDPEAGLWLLLLLFWGAVSAFLMPRLLFGQVMVITADRAAMNSGMALLPLAPTSGNLTQLGYAIGSLLAFVAMQTLLDQPRGPATFRRAVLVLASLNVLAALLNLGEQLTGISGLMELVRNANYATMDGGEVGGLVRISGTFPEASAFSSFTVPLFAFTWSLWRSGQSPRWSGTLAAALLALLAVSTSTTAYAALLLYFACLTGVAIWRVVWNGHTRALNAPLLILWLALFVACLLVLLDPELLNRAADFFQLTLVRKLESSSGIERSSWNSQAWQNFVDTFGFGVGLGSARASSFPMVLLSNLGVIGAALFSMFLLGVFRGAFRGTDADAQRRAVARAAGHAVLTSLIAASISGTVFDLGMGFYAFAAAAAVGLRRTEPAGSRSIGKPAHA